MSLDLFANNIDDAVNHAARVSAPELPSTFTDNFDDAWNKGYLLNQSISGEIRKTTARQRFVDDAIAKTGDPSFAQSGEGGGFDTAAFNAKVEKHRAERPELDIPFMSDDAVQARADEIGKAQLADSAAFDRRERTTGGSIGSFLGSAAAAVTDPVNLIAFPLAAPESLGLLGTALAWGAIGAGSQTAIEALNASSMERIQPGYAESGEPIHNILGAGIGGAVLGGGFKGLSALWQRQRTSAWPRTVRDAGNVVDSEAQIASTNPFVVPVVPEVPPALASEIVQKARDDFAQPGWGVSGNAARDRSRAIEQNFGKDAAEEYLTEYGRLTDQAVAARMAGQRAVEGEAAHRTAVSKAIDDIANGRPVDVESIVTPEQLAALDERALPVLAARDAAAEAQQAARVAAEDALASGKPQPDLPFAQNEAQALADARGASLTESIQNVARLAGHDMPAEDAAKIAARIGQMNDPDKARALLDEVFLRPQTIADTLPAVEKSPSFRPEKIDTDAAASLRDELTPTRIEEARLHPDMEETVARDLDKLMLERPDMEVPTGVTVDAEGRTVPSTRKVSDVVADADARLKAAKEIEACAGPLQTADRVAA